jgi:hypothetical protein
MQVSSNNFFTVYECHFEHIRLHLLDLSKEIAKRWEEKMYQNITNAV